MPPSRASTDKRRELLDCGAELLRERGYHGTGLKAVLARVGIPKGSFYNYFSSKEDFVCEVVRYAAAADRAALEADLADEGTPAAELLERALQSRIDLAEAGGCSRGCLFGNLAGEMGETSEACRAATAGALAALRECYATVLARGQREGAVRDDIDASALADFLVDAWEGSILRMNVERSVEPMRSCVDMTLRSFFRPPVGPTDSSLPPE